jgi:sugar/nucleoside kinase (ribokinase family)
VIGLDDEARHAHELELLAAAGVEVREVPLARGPIFENRETPSGRRQTCAGTSDRIDPEALPEDWREVPAMLLAPVADELDDRWAAAIPQDTLVALAWQGLLRRLEPGQLVVPKPALPRPLFARADLGGVSREDVRAGGGALAELVPDKGRELAMTAGERGSLHLRRRAGAFDIRRVPAVPAHVIVDLVGAGDAFLAALLLARLPGGPFGAEPLPLGRALHLAALVATLTIERVGLSGLPDRDALRARLAEEVRRGRSEVPSGSRASGAGRGTGSP